MRRRTFLQSIQAAAAAPALQPLATSRATPVPLAALYTASPSGIGPRPWARNATGVTDGLLRTPSGSQTLRGLPFELGPAPVTQKSLILLSSASIPGAVSSAEIPLNKPARWLCLATYCDWETVEFDPAGPEDMESIGLLLAEATLLFQDGSTHAFPIRRRYETSPPAAAWGRECFNAIQSNTWRTVGLNDPVPRGSDWGSHQQSVLYQAVTPAALWICALENPRPDQALRALRLDARSPQFLAATGLTLFQGVENPLRHERRRVFRITLPDPAAGPGRWRVETDLGHVVRTMPALDFQPADWLAAEVAALAGERLSPKSDPRLLYAEIACSNEAVITLTDTQSGARHRYDVAGRELTSLRVEILEPAKTWIHGRILDGATNRPTPARLAFRSLDGRYIPPYGHRTEVNAAWFEDYGADTMLGPAGFAYVDGTFQIELPVGDVLVELSKGFEYQPVRRRLSITPGQRTLDLHLRRSSDWRVNGWVTADTHVHFLSPSTALLESQAEGVNLVNLLAAQWGDLFTNVGDLAHGPLLSADRETLVSVGTENRQHLLGHLGLLSGHGEPVFPLSADGPSEAFLGDPLYTSMSDWADACRARDGLVVAVHFPNPNAEMAAEIVRGKVDAVELYPRFDGGFRTLAYQDWYRYLNCGYRVAAAGGTDKMSAATPVGGNRTYAWIGAEEFTFANWAAAVRAGRTFSTTGPLLDFHADGRMPGGEIRLRSGGGAVEVKLTATSIVPFHSLEVVLNGKVVASREEPAGTRALTISETIKTTGPGWIAARCSSRYRAARFGVAAHSSPVYLTVPGEEAFSAPAAAYFLRLIEGCQLYVDNYATRPDAARWSHIRQALKDAHTALHARGVKHAH